MTTERRQQPWEKVLALAAFIALLLSGCSTDESGDAAVNITAACPDCNIVFISLDGLGADHLPCYGYNRDTAPFVCSFAKEGMLFENAFSQVPNTLPSHMSILTSLYPSSHGVREIFKDKLDEGILTLPQILKFYNYTTVWFGSLDCPFLVPEAGYGRGFDERFRSVFTEEECDNSEIFAWLEKQKIAGNKFFLFYHTFQLHAPYTPPVPLFGQSPDHRLNFTQQKIFQEQIVAIKEQFDKNPEHVFSILNITDEATKKKMSDSDFWELSMQGNYPFTMKQYLLAVQGDIQPSEFDLFWQNINKSDASEMAYALSLYDSEIVYADACLNRFFDKLKEEGFYDKTIIIVASDHGEEFLEHGGGRPYPDV